VSKPLDFDVLVSTFLGDKRRKNPSGRTAENYQTALAEFGRWLAELPAEAVYEPGEDGQRPVLAIPAAIEETADIEPDHIRAFVTHLQTRTQLPGGHHGRSSRAGRHLSANTVNNRYRSLQSFFSWMVKTNELEAGRHPMLALVAPETVINPVDVLNVEQMKMIVATCGTGRKRDFIDIRDEAILRVFFEAGSRRGEIGTAFVDDLNMDLRILRIDGTRVKTNHGRDIPFGDKTALALNRYLIARSRHKHAQRPELWLATRGGFTVGGLYQMIVRRGRMADIKVHPHQLRHTFANEFLDNGGEEADLKRLGGWQSDSQVRRYSQARADARAIAAHGRLALGDRI
jgi:integrase/recombinase XerC